MHQRPAQDALVAVGQSVSSLIEPACYTAYGFVVESDWCMALAMVVNTGVVPDAGEHGVQRKAHKHGDQHGGHNGDAKFVEKLADDAAHKANGHENRHDGQGGGQHR